MARDIPTPERIKVSKIEPRYVVRAIANDDSELPEHPKIKVHKNLEGKLESVTVEGEKQ